MCSMPPATTTSQAPSAISPAPAVTAVSAPAHIRSIGEAGNALRDPGEQRDVAAERQSLVADLRRRGEDDVADALGIELRVPAQQLAHRLDAHVVGARPPEDALLARAAERRADAVDEDDLAIHGASLRGCGVLVDLRAQLGQVLAVGLAHLAAVLDEREARHRELAGLADVQQLAQRPEAVAGCVDRVRRLVVVRVVVLGLREVRQVRDDDETRAPARGRAGFLGRRARDPRRRDARRSRARSRRRRD